MKPAWHTCEVSTTLEIIGGRWKTVIVFYLLDGPKRFSEIMRYLPGVTQRMLTRQLRELERDHVLTRHVYPQVPPRVDYQLTEFGHSLKPVLLSMRDWGATYRQDVLNLRSADPASTSTATS
jgi:DNA-binding HxlR family transcriptional regulator